MALRPARLPQIGREACFEIPLSSIYMNKCLIIDRAVAVNGPGNALRLDARANWLTKEYDVGCRPLQVHVYILVRL
jgi:hypothetical protein